MPFRASLKKLIRRDTTAPSLRERAATLRASISPRVAEPRPLPAPGSEEARRLGGLLAMSTRSAPRPSTTAPN